jgi:hypothetical protein
MGAMHRHIRAATEKHRDSALWPGPLMARLATRYARATASTRGRHIADVGSSELRVTAAGTTLVTDPAGSSLQASVCSVACDALSSA